MATVFFTTWAAGMLGILAMCRMDQVAWKFVRFVAVLALALTGLVLAAYVKEVGWQRGKWGIAGAGFSGLTALASFVVLVLAPLAEKHGALLRRAASIGGAAAILASWSWGFDAGLWPQAAVPLGLALVAQMLSAGLIGAVTLATALGHAYLTQTAMTIQPLRRLAVIFAAAIAARSVWAVLVGGGLCWYGVASGVLPSNLVANQTFMLSVRGAVGLIIPAVFAYMVVETARLRSTQSATGILYFAMVLIFIGELSSLFLVREMGVAF